MQVLYQVLDPYYRMTLKSRSLFKILFFSLIVVKRDANTFHPMCIPLQLYFSKDLDWTKLITDTNLKSLVESGFLRNVQSK